MLYRMHIHHRFSSESLDCSFVNFGSELFDGLALGSQARLAYLDLTHKYRNVLLLGVFFDEITTPITYVLRWAPARA
jgi:hypothetical protein